jgi:hypothetical protein
MGIFALQTRLALVVAVQCGLASALHGASVEALYNEINKLPPQQRQKRLEDGARREGAFKFYGVSNAALLSAYTTGFMKRYPFVKAEFWRGSGNKLVFRTLTEHRAGQLDTDAVLVGTENVMTLKRGGIWARYHSLARDTKFRKRVHRQRRLLARGQFGRGDDRLQYQAGKKRGRAQGIRRSFRREVEGKPFHRHGAGASVDGVVDGLGRTEDPGFRRATDETWDSRAPRTYTASATLVRG